MQSLLHNPAALLGLAALGFYLAARAGAAVLDRNGSNPAASAAAHWLPIAAIALALLKSDPQASLHIIFASSVACVTIVLGATLLSMPRATSIETAPITGDQRAWPMLLAAALLAWIAGFHASFTRQHAIVLAIEGIAALMLWTIKSPSMPNDSTPTRGMSVLVQSILFFGWIALSLIGAIVGAHAVHEFAGRAPQFPGGMLAGLMIAPPLALPMIGSSLAIVRPEDQERQPTIDPRRAVTSLCVGCVLLNLCVLLPLTIILRGWNYTPGVELNYPMSIWRIDAVILVVIGAALVPISTGRWKIGKLEGAVLLAGYIFYVSQSVVVARQ